MKARPIAAALAALAGCLLAAACGAGSAGSKTSPTVPAHAVRARVVYQVTGVLPSDVTVGFGNKHESKEVTVGLPWTHVGNAFVGTTVILKADQPRSRYGYRLVCVLSVTIPGHPALVSRDSSHIVGVKAEGGPQKILYDGQCNATEAVSLTGLP